MSIDSSHTGLPHVGGRRQTRLWSEARAEGARRELRALAATSPSTPDVQRAAMDVIARVVPSDAACWATVDPETLLLTGSVSVALEAAAGMEERFVDIELAGRDVHPFTAVVKGPARVVRLSDAGRDAVARSERVNELWRPLGIRHEIRVAFVAGDACWGVAGLLRGRSSRDFDDREVAFLRSVTTTVADALRRTAPRPIASDGGDPDGPAVVVVGADGSVRAATALARARLLGAEPGQLSRTIALRSVVAAVRHGASRASLRLRQADGSWVVLRASPLDGANVSAGGDIAVTVERAEGRETADLVLKAHGLTERERAVCRHLLDGRSTKEISTALYISNHTVQDHLKSIFSKVGVRSRRELVAQLHVR